MNDRGKRSLINLSHSSKVNLTHMAVMFWRDSRLSTFANSAANFWYLAWSVWESELMVAPWVSSNEHLIAEYFEKTWSFQMSFACLRRRPFCFSRRVITWLRKYFKVSRVTEKNKQKKDGGNSERLITREFLFLYNT